MLWNKGNVLLFKKPFKKYKEFNNFTLIAVDFSIQLGLMNARNQTKTSEWS